MTAITDIIGREILDSRGNPTVEVDQGGVDLALVQRLEALDGVGDLAVDVLDGPQHPLAQIPLAAVTQFDRLVRPGRG